MIVYLNKLNTNDFKKILIPPTPGFNVKSWVLVTIDLKNRKFTMKKEYCTRELDESEWEISNVYTFPSTLLRIIFN
jgi:dTDP-4-amino-4,6-dideoxygalactose transaminase